MGPFLVNSKDKIQSNRSRYQKFLQMQNSISLMRHFKGPSSVLPSHSSCLHSSTTSQLTEVLYIGSRFCFIKGSESAVSPLHDTCPICAQVTLGSDTEGNCSWLFSGFFSAQVPSLTCRRFQHSVTGVARATCFGSHGRGLDSVPPCRPQASPAALIVTPFGSFAFSWAAQLHIRVQARVRLLLTSSWVTFST